MSWNTDQRFALLSVSNKTGIEVLAAAFARHNITLLSTGGTAKHLKEKEFDVVDVGPYTGFPELFEGRLKTLHPKVHGGLLYKRNEPKHVAAAEVYDIRPIDFVVVNLYPFEATVAKEGCTMEAAIENIDIGGPTMLRSAAKNHESVTVVTDPADYSELIEQLDANGGTTTKGFRFELFLKVFAHTSHYDTMIFNHFKTHPVAA